MHRLIYILMFFSAAVPAADVLQSYKIDRQNISVSGVSSGGFMAVQLGVAYSALFNGVGSVAGGIYWCAKGDARRAQTVCMNQPEQVQVTEHSRQAAQWASEGLIDPLSHIARQKIYLYASPADFIIKPLHSDKLAEFYAELAPAAPVRFEKSLRSAHGFPTLDQGNACGLGFTPWLLKCNHDTAGAILHHIYGPLHARGKFDRAHLQKFAQSEFDRGGFFYPEGWVYVPESCRAGAQCGLHVALHGCQMNPDHIQDKFVSMAGYNEWAETNNLIILYPQSAQRRTENPYGCWDWFGFSGVDYAQKSGVQMAGIHLMIERLAGH